MALPWFRMYAEFATDAKVQSMDETLQRRFIMLLCLHCKGEYDSLKQEELAFALRITPEQLAETLQVFKSKGFLDQDGKISNWNKRQYVSDSSTERSRKHRQRKRNGDATLRNVAATAPDTDTDTELRTTAALRPAPPEFEEFKAAFPKRAGNQPWRRALKAAAARVSEGHDWAEMISGARRYSAWCASTSKVGTEHVMQAATFCGPDKPFLQTWDPGIQAPKQRKVAF